MTQHCNSQIGASKIHVDNAILSVLLLLRGMVVSNSTVEGQILNLSLF